MGQVPRAFRFMMPPTVPGTALRAELRMALRTAVAAIGLLLLLAALLFGGPGCAPETDLWRESTSGGGDPAGGSAAGALVDPQAGTVEVPSNLAAVVVRLPVAIVVAPVVAPLVTPDDSDFRLRLSEGAGSEVAVGLGPAAAVACTGSAPGACYRIPVTEALQPNRTYLVELLAGALQEDGAAAATGVIGAFDTAASADDVAPQVVDFAVALDGPCVGVRFTTDEAVDAQIVIQTDTALTVAAAGSGQTAFDLAVTLAGLAPGAAAQIGLRVTDRAGNATEASAGVIQVPAQTPPLVITEVLANPAGPEPGQEFVELRNLGDVELSLVGLRIEDSRGADVLPDAVLQPGAYALIVPSTFDPVSPRDVSPRAGTLLVPVDARIGSDGLSNSGEVVRLRMPGTGAEPIVSSYGGDVDVSAASAAGKSVHRLTDDACDHPSAWTRPPRVPTPGWGTPP